MEDPTILRPLDDNATQGLEDSKAIEPSLMPSSSSSASSSPILTRQEVGELGRFSQGKARIQQSLQLLEGRVKPDAFYTLAGVDAAMDREQMMASWVDLDAAVAENDQARADRDRIEDEAQHFDVADMERLRKLAKAVSAHQMSPADTDVVEVALETLVLLEKLRHQLAAHDAALNLMSSRLSWEQARRSCWLAFFDTATQLNRFVAERARWTGPSKSSITLEALVAEAQELTSNLQHFTSVLIASAEEALDNLIEQHKVPEALLDEQDRIEALGEDLGSRLNFVAELLEQWAKADDLDKTIEEVHSNAGSLLVDQEEAKSARPTLERCTSFNRRTEELTTVLNDLAGSSAVKFLSHPDVSSHKLNFTIHHSLPMPRHDRWPEQHESNVAASSLLRKSLARTGVKVRQAVQGTSDAQSLQRSYDRAETARTQLDHNTQAAQDIAVQPESLGQSIVGDGQSIGNGDWKASLRAYSARDDLLDYKQWIDQVGGLHSSFEGLKAQANRLLADMSEGQLQCQSRGLKLPDFFASCENTSSTWQKAESTTSALLTEAGRALEVLGLLSSLRVKVDELSKEFEASLKSIAQAAADSRFKTDDPGHTEAGVPDYSVDRNLQGARLEEVLSILLQVQTHSFAKKVSSDLEVAQSRIAGLQARAKDCRALQGWTKLLLRQRRAAAETWQRYQEVSSQGQKLRVENEGLTSEAVLNNLERQSEAFAASVNRFEALQEDSIIFIGPAPAVTEGVSLLLKDLGFSSPDEELRSISTTWCLRLARLRDDIRVSLQRVRDLLEEREAEARRAEEDARERELQEQREAEARRAEEEEERQRKQREATERQQKDRQRDLEISQPLQDEPIIQDQSGSADGEATAIAVNGLNEDAKPGEKTPVRSCTIEPDARAGVPPSPTETQESSFELGAEALQDTTRLLTKTEATFQAFNSDLSRRRKNFRKALTSVSSRRLPPRAFVAELANRRADAEESLTGRLDDLRRRIDKLEQLIDNSPTGVPPDVVTDPSFQERHQQNVVAVKELLKDFDQEIGTEESKLDASPTRKSLDTGITSSLSASLDVFNTPSPKRSISMTSSCSSSPQLVHSFEPEKLSADDQLTLRQLSAKLNGGRIELQTTPPDGLTQAKRLVDLPTMIEAAQEQEEWEELHLKAAQVLNRLTGHQEALSISTLVKQRAEKLLRFGNLAIFDQQAREMERALGMFLDALDCSSGSFLDSDMAQEDSSSPTPSIDGLPLASGASGNSRDSLMASATYQPIRTTESQGESIDISQLDIQAQLTSLDQALAAMSKAAEAVENDVRVRERMGQINRSYVDMAEMARDILEPSQRPSSALSFTTSATDESMSVMGSPSLDSFSFAEPLPSLAAMDEKFSRKNSIPIRKQLSNDSLHRRVSTASNTSSSSRSRTSSLASIPPPSATAERAAIRAARLAASSSSVSSTTSRIPHAALTTPKRRSSAGPLPGTPQHTALRSRLPSITGSPATPTAAGALSRLAGDDEHATPTRRTPSILARTPGSHLPIRSGSSLSTRSESKRGLFDRYSSTPKRQMNSSPDRRPNSYRPNTKNTLDVAMSKIVNRMPVPVKIVHASKAKESSGKASSEWKDDSGRYWVGHPDPKLCFCRILRSRTIMVRVGGGWQELTRYIMQHYDLSASGVALRPSPSAADKKKGSPIESRKGTAQDSSPWISAASLRAAKQSGSAHPAGSPSTHFQRTPRATSGRSPLGKDISSPILFDGEFDSPQRLEGSSSPSPGPVDSPLRNGTRTSSMAAMASISSISSSSPEVEAARQRFGHRAPVRERERVSSMTSVLSLTAWQGENPSPTATTTTSFVLTPSPPTRKLVSEGDAPAMTTEAESLPVLDGSPVRPRARLSNGRGEERSSAPSMKPLSFDSDDQSRPSGGSNSGAAARNH